MSSGIGRHRRGRGSGAMGWTFFLILINVGFICGFHLPSFGMFLFWILVKLFCHRPPSTASRQQWLTPAGSGAQSRRGRVHGAAGRDQCDLKLLNGFALNWLNLG